MRLLAIDPGRNFAAGSEFYGPELIHCQVSALPKEGKLWSLGDVCAYHARLLHNKMFDRVIVERMQLRKADGATSRLVALANDLFELQSVGAYIAGKAAPAVLEYVPHFAVPKLVTKNRVLHLLTPSEHDVLAAGAKNMKKFDDLFDSIALGLRAVGRLG